MRSLATRLDALSVFTLLFAHSLALQVVKDARVFLPVASPQILITLPLAVAICACHTVTTPAASAAATTGLALSALVVLGLHGSQSNHVLLEAAVAAAVLLTAPTPLTEATAARQAWTDRLVVSLRAILIVLYCVAAFAKLNDGWFDPRYSCCVHMAACVLGDWMPSSPTVLGLLPTMALVFEVAMPLALLVAGLTEATGANQHGTPGADARTASRRLRGRRASLVRRTCALLGSGFHIVIALPPPPVSVYPFSMLMAPLYVGLIPAECAAAAQAAAAASRHFRALACAALAAALAAATALAQRSSHFEYPPYFSWELGALWVLIAFGALSLAALCAPDVVSEVTADASAAAPPPPPLPPPGISRGRLALAMLPAAFILAVGAAPYLGVRTHPAFAMFSNLRIEGGASNHWLVATPSAAHDGNAPVYGHDVALEIVDTDLPTLRLLQVNLAPLLPPPTLAALRRLDVAAEFYISPPGWGRPPTEAFRPFAVPLIEARRRMADAAASGLDFFVRYRLVGGGQGTRVYRRRHGNRTAESDAALDEPVTSFRSALHRYRTFDVSYAPCRH